MLASVSVGKAVFSDNFGAIRLYESIGFSAEGLKISARKLEDRYQNDILAVNLSAAFHTMRHALPRMAQAKYGRVINIASVHGLVASASKAPYVSAKFGLVGLSKVAALEYAQVGDASSGGVTINCICPGWVDTALLTPQITERQQTLGISTAAAVDALLAEKQPTRRLSTPQEIARLALWLCAPEAHNVTGSAIPVDGGWTAQ